LAFSLMEHYMIGDIIPLITYLLLITSLLIDGVEPRGGGVAVHLLPCGAGQGKVAGSDDRTHQIQWTQQVCGGHC